MIVAEEGAGSVGEEDDVIVSGCALGDCRVDGYFLREGVGLFVVLPEEMVVVP